MFVSSGLGLLPVSPPPRFPWRRLRSEVGGGRGKKQGKGDGKWEQYGQYERKGGKKGCDIFFVAYLSNYQTMYFHMNIVSP